MSPVVDLQRQLREIGRIRMGEKRISKNGREYPAAIDRFRFTCASRGILEAMAAEVGGTVEAWESPAGPQWQLTSTASDIAVVVPPMEEPFSQWYELWSAAGCQRRCDGQRATIATERGSEIVMSERACVCNAENRECKLTTRASLILPWAPGIGVWRLESHGYYAAVELTGTLQYLAVQASQGVYMECRLRLDKRTKRVPGQPTNEYVVPVLDTDATPAQLMAGGIVPSEAPQIASRERPALPASTPPPSASEAPMADPVAATGKPGWGSAPTPPSGEDAKRGEPAGDDRPITDAQHRRLMAISKKAGVDHDALKEITLRITGQDSTKAITRDHYESVVDAAEHHLDAAVAEENKGGDGSRWRGDPGDDDPGPEWEQSGAIPGQEVLG